MCQEKKKNPLNFQCKQFAYTKSNTYFELLTNITQIKSSVQQHAQDLPYN